METAEQPCTVYDVAKGPRFAIRNCGRTIAELAQAAGLDRKTIQKAAATNAWPAQRRTRQALAATLVAIGIGSSHG